MEGEDGGADGGVGVGVVGDCGGAVGGWGLRERKLRFDMDSGWMKGESV